MGAYSSFKKILKRYNADVEKVVFHDTPALLSHDKVVLLSNIYTASLVINKNGQKDNFIVPSYLYLPFILEKGEFYLPTPTKRKASNNDVMYS